MKLCCLPSFAEGSVHSGTVAALRCNQARNTDDSLVLLQSCSSGPHMSLSLSLSLTVFPVHPSLSSTSSTIISTLQHSALYSHQLKNQFHLPIQAQNIVSTTAAKAVAINPVIIQRTEEVACNSTDHPLQ